MQNKLVTMGIAALLAMGHLTGARAVGRLETETPAGGELRILDHELNVTINNGFARSEILQTFENTTGADVPARYRFPLPRSASLSEMEIVAGDETIRGEVLPKDRARQVHEEEASRGHDTGLAEKDGYESMEFRIARIPAQSQVRVRVVYYQPLALDSGILAYTYPLADGGTSDTAAQSFWTHARRADRAFRARVEVRSGWPVADLRVPGFESAVQIDRKDDGHYMVRLEQAATALDHDFVLYYRLADDLPGRVELLTHRPDANEPGTFMMIVTPGVDLAPLRSGGNYTFVLDVSGSMQTKIRTLTDAVSRALGDFTEMDQFRIVVFSDRARELTSGWLPATAPHVRNAIDAVQRLQVEGGTNLFEGLAAGLDDLAADRVNSVILVTDGVANQGIVDPARFENLVRERDVRVFGFLMGNSANWPLMDLVCRASGGFYAAVSNDDDVLGQIMLARSKIRHEALHDARLTIEGIPTADVVDRVPRKIYRGQQLVVFGRYEKGGEATVTLDARITGKDRRYRTVFDFPETSQDYPELERLWAMARVEEIEQLADTGKLPSTVAEKSVEELGVAYQIVTDQTAMVVLSDAGHIRNGIERKNLKRTTNEHHVQAHRQAQPVRTHRVDAPVSPRPHTPHPSKRGPMFSFPAPRLGGGGALDPASGLLALSLVVLGAVGRRERDED